MEGADALQQRRVVHRVLRRLAVEPVVEAAGRDAPHASRRAHGEAGLVRVHELAGAVNVLPRSAANQDVATARMSRSICSRRFSRRSRANSSRSALLGASAACVATTGLMPVAAIQLAIVCAEQPDSRDSYAGVRPAATSSTLYGTHKTDASKRWLAARPRSHAHVTPTSASWLNQVERQCFTLTDRCIRRGTTADDILVRVKRFCLRTSQSGHWRAIESPVDGKSACHSDRAGG